MSRLLHAAARGARVQRQHFTATYWEPSRLVWAVEPQDCDYDYRIHPDDEHLQYGPISSALREDAEVSPAYYFDPRISEETCFAIGTHRVSGLYDMADPMTRSLFLLILAEALADGGL